MCMFACLRHRFTKIKGKRKREKGKGKVICLVLCVSVCQCLCDNGSAHNEDVSPLNSTRPSDSSGNSSVARMMMMMIMMIESGSDRAGSDRVNKHTQLVCTFLPTSVVLSPIVAHTHTSIIQLACMVSIGSKLTNLLCGKKG